MHTSMRSDMITHCLSDDCRDHRLHQRLHYDYLAAREKFPITVEKPMEGTSESEDEHEEPTPVASVHDSKPSHQRRRSESSYEDDTSTSGERSSSPSSVAIS